MPNQTGNLHQPPLGEQDNDSQGSQQTLSRRANLSKSVRALMVAKNMVGKIATAPFKALGKSWVFGALIAILLVVALIGALVGLASLGGGGGSSLPQPISPNDPSSKSLVSQALALAGSDQSKKESLLSAKADLVEVSKELKTALVSQSSSSSDKILLVNKIIEDSDALAQATSKENVNLALNKIGADVSKLAQTTNKPKEVNQALTKLNRSIEQTKFAFNLMDSDRVKLILNSTDRAILNSYLERDSRDLLVGSAGRQQDLALIKEMKDYLQSKGVNDVFVDMIQEAIVSINASGGADALEIVLAEAQKTLGAVNNKEFVVAQINKITEILNNIEQNQLEGVSLKTKNLPPIDRRTLQTLVYLVTPGKLGGAGHERIRVSRIWRSYTNKKRQISRESEGAVTISRHALGQALDIDQVDYIKCTFIKKRHFGRTKKHPMPPRPIKVAWQTPMGISDIQQGSPSSLMGAVKSSITSQYASAFADIGLLDTTSPSPFDNPSILDVTSVAGQTAFLEAIGLDPNEFGDSLLEGDLLGSAELIGRRLLEQKLNLPRHSLVGSNINDLSQNIGRRWAEERFGLPEGSLRGSSTNAILMATGLASFEAEMNIPVGSLSQKISSKAELEMAIGRGLIAKAYGLKRDDFRGSNLAQLREIIGDYNLGMIMADVAKRGNLLAHKIEDGIAITKDQISPDEFARRVGAKKLDDTVRSFKKSNNYNPQDNAIASEPGGVDKIMSGDMGGFMLLGARRIAQAFTSDRNGQIAMRNLLLGKNGNPEEISDDYVEERLGITTEEFLILFNHDKSKKTSDKLDKDSQSQGEKDIQFVKDDLGLQDSAIPAGPKRVFWKIGSHLLVKHLLKSNERGQRMEEIGNFLEKNTKEIYGSYQLLDPQYRTDLDDKQFKLADFKKMIKRDYGDKDQKNLRFYSTKVGGRHLEEQLDFPTGSMEYILDKTRKPKNPREFFSLLGTRAIQQEFGEQASVAQLTKDPARTDLSLSLAPGTTRLLAEEKITPERYREMVGEATIDASATGKLADRLPLGAIGLSVYDVYDLLAGHRKGVYAKMGGQLLDDLMGFPAGTGRGLVSAFNDDERETALMAAGISLVFSGLGVKAESLQSLSRLPIPQSVGSSKLANAFSLAINSYTSSSSAEDIIKIKGPIDFLVAIGIKLDEIYDQKFIQAQQIVSKPAKKTETKQEKGERKRAGDYLAKVRKKADKRIEGLKNDDTYQSEDWKKIIPYLDKYHIGKENFRAYLLGNLDNKDIALIIGMGLLQRELDKKRQNAQDKLSSKLADMFGLEGEYRTAFQERMGKILDKFSESIVSGNFAQIGIKSISNPLIEIYGFKMDSELDLTPGSLFAIYNDPDNWLQIVMREGFKKLEQSWRIVDEDGNPLGLLDDLFNYHILGQPVSEIADKNLKARDIAVERLFDNNKRKVLPEGVSPGSILNPRYGSLASGNIFAPQETVAEVAQVGSINLIKERSGNPKLIPQENQISLLDMASAQPKNKWSIAPDIINALPEEDDAGDIAISEANLSAVAGDLGGNSPVIANWSVTNRRLSAQNLKTKLEIKNYSSEKLIFTREKPFSVPSQQSYDGDFQIASPGKGAFKWTLSLFSSDQLIDSRSGLLEVETTAQKEVLRELQEKTRREKLIQARERLYFKMTDAMLFKLNDKVPAGFTEAMYKGKAHVNGKIISRADILASFAVGYFIPSEKNEKYSSILKALGAPVDENGEIIYSPNGSITLNFPDSIDAQTILFSYILDQVVPVDKKRKYRNLLDSLFTTGKNGIISVNLEFSGEAGLDKLIAFSQDYIGGDFSSKNIQDMLSFFRFVVTDGKFDWLRLTMDNDPLVPNSPSTMGKIESLLIEKDFLGMGHKYYKRGILKALTLGFTGEVNLIKEIKKLYGNWLKFDIDNDLLLSFGDRVLGLPKGTFEQASGVYRAYRALKKQGLLNNFESLQYYVQITDVFTGGKATRTINELEADLGLAPGTLMIAVKTALTTPPPIGVWIALIQLTVARLIGHYAEKFARIDDRFKVAQGTTIALVTTWAFFGPTAWVQMALIILIGLFTWSKIYIYCTADGYYPQLDKPPEYDSTDLNLGLGEFDGMNPKEYQARAQEAAKAKVSDVIGDILDMPYHIKRGSHEWVRNRKKVPNPDFGQYGTAPMQIITYAEDTAQEFWGTKRYKEVFQTSALPPASRTGIGWSDKLPNAIHVGF